MQLNDYSDIADLYDIYVQADFDLDFFSDRAARTTGPVLELMAGTGRVSTVLYAANPRLTCVDAALPMLQRLRARFSRHERMPTVVCADVRALPLGQTYELIVIPFHSFSELVDGGDRRLALREIWRSLRPGGRFICTLHNPASRLARIDGRVRQIGAWTLPDGRRELRLGVRESFDRRTGIAEARQTFRIYDPDGNLQSERVQTLRFALLERQAFQERLEEIGFEVIDLHGDYDGSAFDPAESPFMIWVLRKPEETR